MRLLVTGRDGQVARSLRERALNFPDLKLLFVSRPELDLTKPDSIAATIQKYSPNIVVSAAAYTNVDMAETETELAHQINAVAPGLLAKTAHNIGARVIHVSTDYVFDGTLPQPYIETDNPKPLNVYGNTKLAGEQSLRSGNPDHLILRSSWIYGPYGSNFLKTMVRLARLDGKVEVVDDQLGNPTSSHDVADGILTIAEHWKYGDDRGLGKTYHFAGTGDTNWFEFANFIIDQSNRLTGTSTQVTPIKSSQYMQSARRPANSRLDSSKWQREFGHHVPDWRTSTLEVLTQLLSNKGCQIR